MQLLRYYLLSFGLKQKKKFTVQCKCPQMFCQFLIILSLILHIIYLHRRSFVKVFNLSGKEHDIIIYGVIMCSCLEKWVISMCKKINFKLLCIQNIHLVHFDFPCIGTCTYYSHACVNINDQQFTLFVVFFLLFYRQWI